MPELGSGRQAAQRAVCRPFFSQRREQTMRFENTSSRFKSIGPPWQLTEGKDLPIGSRYAHILVPTSLDPNDCGPLLLGVEMALVHRATLTILHVVPAAPADGLDAFDHLHQAFDQVHLGSVDRTRQQVTDFLARFVPEQVWDKVKVRIACRAGAVADSIAQFAEQTEADLVIISAGTPRWWMPILPAHVRRLLRRARPQVIIVRPNAVARGRRHGEQSLASVER
jgi:nucleotide-binding universal stress UspA family protein